MRRRTSSSRFIGRAEQIGLFDDVLSDLTTGVDAGGHVLLIGGEAGVGKSRLVDEWAARARSAGAPALRGWCVEHGDAVMPLAPIADLLRDAAAQAACLPEDELGPEADDLARLAPVFNRRPGQPPEHAAQSLASLADGLLRVLYGLSARRPLIVVLEDLHWSDASTQQLLMFLGPRISSRRIALIATYRTDELHRRHPLRPFLGSWQRAARPVQVDLPPFSRDEVGELMSGFTGLTPESAVIDRLYRRCAGNAFFAEELLAGDDLGRPSMLLRDAVLARTQGPDESALTVLRTASAAGRTSSTVLAAASGLDAKPCAAAVEDLVAAGLCVRDGETVSFRHDLAREIVQDEVLAVDRRAVHRALASTMQAIAPDRRGEIARHWLLAGERVSALTASVAAARAAADVGADAEAFTQFERALELWDLVPGAGRIAGCDHATLLLDAADAAGRARQFGKAIELGRRGVTETASSGADAEAAACLRLIPWTWFGVDDNETGRLLDRASRATEDPPGVRTALTLGWRAMLTLSEWRHDRPGADLARPIAQRAFDLARIVDSAQAQANARLTLGVCACIEGKPEGLQDIRAALETAKAGGFAMEAGRAYDNLAYYLSEFWRHDEVIDLEPEAMDYCAAAGINRVQGTMVQLRVIRALQLRGRLADVERRVADLRAEFGSLDIEHLSLADTWGLIRVRQGRLDQVQELVDAAFVGMVSHESVIGPTTVVAIELQAARGTVTGIPNLVDSALSSIVPRFAEHAAEVAAAAIRALADFVAGEATEYGQEPAYGRLADRWLELVEEADPPSIPPWLVIAKAERARLAGEPSDALWRKAVAAWRDLGSPYELAYSAFRLNEAMLSGADRQSAVVRGEARTSLIEARRIADRLAAAPLRDRIDALATRAHLSLMTTHSRSVSRSEDDHLGLTDREREVLGLVAEGYSNGQIGQALFISRKTASVHVSNILRKLGVSSRVEAATRSVRARTD
ncbi:AAA family ATPase [Nakamurella sp.]|uniref:helix-turn-helix transcriptional regulator n=1 Tax=Nakamurella sp. TaxID=1869182 RepID=UPI003783E5BC